MQNGSYKTYTSTLASSNSSRAFSLVGCHIGMSKYLTRKGQTTLSRTKNKKNLPQREMRNKGIDITKTMHSPQDWSWRLHPVLPGPLRSEQINWRAVLRMSLHAAIETTQIGQSIMQVAVVMLDQRALPGIINISNYTLPPVPGFHVVGHIYSTKTFILWREPANRTGWW